MDPNDGTADSVTVCRRVIDGEYAEVSVVKIAGHKMSYEYRRQAPAHTFGRRSIGDMIRLRVDTTAAGSVVDAYSASELGKDGKPAWVHIAKVRSTSAFLWQGLAGTDDVLFVDTLRNGVVIRTSDLVAGAVPGATLRDLSSVP